jgi:hypothetical protein
VTYARRPRTILPCTSVKRKSRPTSRYVSFSGSSVIVGFRDQPYKMCVNMDRASGKVRPSFFLNPSP